MLFSIEKLKMKVEIEHLKELQWLKSNAVTEAAFQRYPAEKLQKQPFVDVLQNSVPKNFAKFKGKHMCRSFF